jgi:hypothetical protein
MRGALDLSKTSFILIGLLADYRQDEYQGNASPKPPAPVAPEIKREETRK